MTTHATLSPSSRYRRQGCPGSVRETARYEAAGQSSAGAIDGTHSHTLLEACIKHATHPNKYVGMVLTDHEGMFAVDTERALRVAVAYEYIMLRMAEMPGCFVVAEQRVDPAPLVGRTDMSGTVDVQIHFGTTLEIIDYKDGMNPVEAEGNPQLEQYFAGVVAGVYSRGGTMPYEKVRLTIIQPKLRLKGMNPIITADYDARPLLDKVVADLILEGADCDNPDAPLVPGEKQCHYCPHKANCLPFQQWVLDKSGIKFENMAQQAAQQGGDDTSDEQLRQIIEAAPLLRKMIEAAEQEAERRITAGHPIPGLKMVRGRGSRSWAQDEDETAKKLTRMGIPKKEVYRQVILSPSQAEKLKWVKRDGTETQLSQAQVDRLNKEFVKMSEGRLTVVPESDRRGKIDFGDFAKMFSAVEPQETPSPELPLPAWLS